MRSACNGTDRSSEDQMGMDRERSVTRFLPLRPVEFDVLLSLAAGERHGYGIIQDIEARGDGTVTVETGTLYRALQRLVEGGLASPAEPPPDAAELDERRRYYAITPEGRRIVAAEARRMASLVDRARAARLIPEGA